MNDKVKPQLRINPSQFIALDLHKADKEHSDLARAVRLYDRDSFLYYNKSINRWSIGHASDEGLFHVLTWAWPDGSYRSLDYGVLSYLKRADLWKSGHSNADKLADSMEDQQESIEKKTDADLEDDIGHLSRANRKQQQQMKDLLSSF